MPDKNLWLRKIAAFLHDPPYKVWALEKVQNYSRDKDVVNLFKLAVPNKTFPFPLDPQRSNRIDRHKRYFHHISGSSFKNSIFGVARTVPRNKEPKFLKNGEIVIHTLSGELITMAQLKLRFSNHPDYLVKNFIQAFVTVLQSDKIKFLTLWRRLYEYLLQNREEIQIFLPVDTRLPEQTVQDFSVIQSAIAATTLPTGDPKVQAFFLILEFGPVQSFIENAKKTRDLWFGSWLISYLSWHAMKPIACELGPDNIVYPDLYKQPLVDQWLRDEVEIDNLDFDQEKLKLPTLPNTFLAIVPEGKEKELADQVKEQLTQKWQKIREQVLNLETKLKNTDKKSLTLKEIWSDEISNKFLNDSENPPFQIYWLGLKWGEDSIKAIEDYKNIMEPDTCWEFGRLWEKMRKRDIKPNIGDTYSLLVEMAQTGLKAMKYRGKPQAVDEPWEKCTLCGERSALVDIDLEKLEQEEQQAEKYVNELIEKFKYHDLNGEKNFKKKRNKLYYRHLKEFWKKMSDAFPGHIKENEHLCAVCLVKRLAPKIMLNKYGLDYHFPSTGSIALAPFVEKLIEKKVDLSPIEKALENLLNQSKETKSFLDAHFTEGRTVPGIKNRIIPQYIAGEKFEGDFEPEWFYDESFPRFYEELKSRGDEDKIDLAKGIEEAVFRIKKEAKDKLQDNYYLPKYYAAVYLDGDDLGKWLRGDNAPKIEQVFHPDFVKHVSNNPHFKSIRDLKRPVTPAIHRAISGALRDFALEVVPYVVEENLGVVIYSGGDDTLFLTPLENLLDTLIALRKLYSGESYVVEAGSRRFESEKGFIKIYENGNLKEIIRVMGTKATLSAGIAIAHYLDPLDITLRNARTMLKEAKTKTPDKKDKAGFKVIMHSGSERKAVVPWRFVEVMKRFKQGVSNGMSTRFIRTLYEKIDVYDEIPDAFDAEFIKFGLRGSGERYKDLLCRLKEARREAKLTPKEFLDALLIAEFLTRGEGAK